ncbi:hypothetical protein D9758_006413 [Tetrapyrgos nigripes]|uniref:Uncharacterized protein n=1 Tax=Tetrapyrgos nigripes TaxID=182062 RepID=A0A8H5DA90_9AGAR|nr:hypothetical protein D9758_006413 [Tetrapyrgos nigripes]
MPVIGARTAGLVVASRLSEDVKTTVCILEVGQNLVETPEMFKDHNASMNDRVERFNTVPQPGIKNRSIYHQRGKTVEGTSSTDDLSNDRGHADDYDGEMLATGEIDVSRSTTS